MEFCDTEGVGGGTAPGAGLCCIKIGQSKRAVSLVGVYLFGCSVHASKQTLCKHAVRLQCLGLGTGANTHICISSHLEPRPTETRPKHWHSCLVARQQTSRTKPCIIILYQNKERYASCKIPRQKNTIT